MRNTRHLCGVSVYMGVNVMKRDLAKKITLALAVGAFVMTSSTTVSYAYGGWNYVETWFGEKIYEADDPYAAELCDPTEVYEGCFYGGYDKMDGADVQGYSLNVDNASGVTFNGSCKISGSNYKGGTGKDNTVTVNNTVFGSDTKITAAWASDKGMTSENNTVTITNSTFENADIMAADGYREDSNNTVTIENSTFNGDSTIRGSQAAVNAGVSPYTTICENNTVTITNTTMNGTAKIYGGYAKNGSALTATGHTVNIKDCVFNGETSIYGGYAVLDDAHRDADVNISNNTVNISGNNDLSNVSLYGGATEAEDAYLNKRYTTVYGGEETPNTLNIGMAEEDWENQNIGSIEGFDVINFNNLEWDTSGAALTVGNLSANPNGGTALTVTRVANPNAVSVGDKMTLIQATANTSGQFVPFDPDRLNKNGLVGLTNFLQAEGLISTEPTKINLTISRIVGNAQALLIGESRTAATAFVNQGSELIETGLDALHRDETADDVKVFAALYNGASKFETGSHIKVNGWSGIVGVGKTTDDGLTYGAFFESGEGNYRTYNYFNRISMRGDGESNYNGGGLLIRKDHDKGFYAEASLRAGNLSNRLDGAVVGPRGFGGYDIDSFYYGAHIGIGKIIPKGADSLDVYGKFLYTHHDGETFDIGGDEFRFDSVDSQRLRLGFRYNQAQTDKVGLYYGAAWEYEFGGDADNRVVGYELSTPSLEGSTVIGEFGMHYLVNTKWSLDANVRGYTGQRDGWSGSVQANYSF